jgi:ribosomal protein L11 methyltransferase
VQATPEGGVALLAYFHDRPGLVAELRDSLAPFGASVEPAEIPQVDWVARFREGFRPQRAGRFLIVPEWRRADPDADSDAVCLRVDPGRAFGTGTHETTRLCLAALERLARAGRLGRVLDLGSGTGILGVAAARLGAGPVVAADIDPDATAASRRHAHLNGVVLHCVLGDGGRPLRAGAFDLVLANLTAPLLHERRHEILGLRSPAGRLVLSGFLEEDVASLRADYAPAGPLALLEDGEWAALLSSPVGTA